MRRVRRSFRQCAMLAAGSPSPGSDLSAAVDFS
jgi:hypothetical protein